MEKSTVYLNDILESIEKIEGYLDGFKAMDFENDSAIQDAVMRRLEIIGEAVKRLPEKMKSEYSDIPWRNIAGMRDILIHEYAGVQTERVWRTVKNDLPPLKRVMAKLIKEN